MPEQAVNPATIKQTAHTRNFGLSEFKSRTWFYELAEDQSYEDCLDPNFWHHVAAQIMGHNPANPLGRGDDIVCWKPDTGHKFRLTVLEVGRGYLKTVPWVEQAKAPDVAIPENSPLTTRWNVGKKSHDVIRTADAMVMAQGFQTKATALAWINDHLKKLAA